MFFNCTSCSTRLELPDEQVANRVLKVRCTGCGTVMVVRDPATNRSERPSETQWFYAIAGQQRGPVAAGALKQLVASGELDARTFVWAAGMAQWLRASEVPALSSLFTVQAPPPLPPPVPPATPAPDPTRLEAEARARALTEAKAKAEQEARAKAEQEAKAKAEQEAKAKAEQEAKAKAEQEARAKAEQEARAKAEQEAKAKAEQEARAKAEQEAKAKAEQEAKAKAEQEARAKAEQEAKAKAEQEARAKAEQEAKAKAEQEAKAKAEQEAKAKAEQEAKAKAEQEAKAKAEQDAKAKAEQEAKAKAEQDAKAKAEQEAKAKAEQDAKAKAEKDLSSREELKAQQARTRAEEAKARAEQIARSKAEVDAKVRAELEAKAAADKAEQELRDAVSQALAAAQTAPDTGQAPTSITHHIEENFFSTPPAHAPVDIFANLDEKPDEQEMADFRKTLRAARPEAGPRTPTRAEMRALAQEFSVVTKLEQHKKKHGLWIGIGVAAAAAIVAVVLLLVPRSSGPEFAANDEGFEAFQRRLYAAPEKPTEPEIPAAPEVPQDNAGKSDPTPNKRVGTGARKDPKAGNATASKPGEGESKKPITAEKYAALTQDSLGKSEFKLDFDAGAAAKKAADEAAAKKSQRADELSAEVASAFGKKKAQFAKCSDDLQERIRVVFTVSATGKVSGPAISGTQNSNKSQCIQQILERSIFPAGDSDLTYSQVLVL